MLPFPMKVLNSSAAIRISQSETAGPNRFCSIISPAASIDSSPAKSIRNFSLVVLSAAILSYPAFRIKLVAILIAVDLREPAPPISIVYIFEAILKCPNWKLYLRPNQAPKIEIQLHLLNTTGASDSPMYAR